MQTEQKLVLTSAALMLVWSLSWSPYAGVFLANIAGHAELVTNHVDMIPGQWLPITFPQQNNHDIQKAYYSNLFAAIFAKLSSAVNPIIYGLM